MSGGGEGTKNHFTFDTTNMGFDPGSAGPEYETLSSFVKLASNFYVWYSSLI